MPEELLQFAGRLHPMVLHLPIGILVLLALMEIAAGARRVALSPAIRSFVCWAFAIFAVVSAASGWMLSREGGYSGETLTRHFLLGIATAALALLTAICSVFPKLRIAYVLCLGAAVVTTTAAGHLGSQLTHGADWLWAPFHQKPVAPSDPLPRGRATEGLSHAGGDYELHVASIFAAHCIECHGDNRKKARLALNTYDAILSGGAHGRVIDRDMPEQSELLRRILLPADDDDRMPPTDKSALTEDEINSIRTWVLSGANR